MARHCLALLNLPGLRKRGVRGALKTVGARQLSREKSEQVFAHYFFDLAVGESLIHHFLGEDVELRGVEVSTHTAVEIGPEGNVIFPEQVNPHPDRPDDAGGSGVTDSAFPETNSDEPSAFCDAFHLRVRQIARARAGAINSGVGDDDRIFADCEYVLHHCG